MAMLLPDFSFYDTTIISRFGSSEVYKLSAALDINASKKYLDSMESCYCEESIKKHLLSSKSSSFSEKDAKEMILTAQMGWSTGKFFTFFIVSSKNEIVGAIEIKNNLLKYSEIDYWVSSKHSGLATNALRVVIEAAKRAGYKKLFAQTESCNTKSVDVLRRNSFEADYHFLSRKDCDDAFFVNLA